MHKIIRRNFNKRFFTAVLSAVAAVMATGNTAAKNLPNILLIIDDQHNPRAMGWTGQSQAITPHLDRLAEESVCFTNAYCANPVCAPTRHSIYSGLYSSEHGVLINDLPMKEGITTLTAHLNKAGYTTANIGKMHNAPYHHRRDFQYVLHHEFYIDSAGISHYASFLKTELEKRGLQLVPWYKSKDGDKRIWLNDPERLAFTYPMPEDLTAEHWITDQALEFMRDQLKNRPGKPFFLHASYFPPHHPYGPIDKYAGLYDPKDIKLPPNFDRAKINQWCERNKTPDQLSDEQIRRMLAHYYGFVSQLDAEVGRLLEGLKELGIADNTLVIFTSDHGDMLSEHGLFYKNIMYEGAARIPLMIRWPDVQKARQESALVSHVDILPTIIRAVGIEPDSHLPGKDLRSLIAGNSNSWKNRSVYAESFTHLPFGSLMLRKGAFKLIARTKSKTDSSIEYELYNIEEDPWELTDLSSHIRYSKILDRQREELMIIWGKQKKFLPRTIPPPMKRSRYNIAWPADPWGPIKPIGISR